MKTIRAVLIDDEPDAVESLQIMLDQYCQQVEVVGKANSIIDGIKQITAQKPDLVFLDIEMPHGTGFDVLEGVGYTVDFKVIFVTAYDSYAIKAIKFDALDYLLKPLHIDALELAVEKARKELEKSTRFDYSGLVKQLHSNLGNKLAIPTQNGLRYIEITDIIRIEANGDYCEVHLLDEKALLVSRKLKKFEEILSERGFLRVHHSHLINLQHVKAFNRADGGYLHMTDDSMVHVSRKNKEQVQEVLKNITEQI